jgi:hypothetical protein
MAHPPMKTTAKETPAKQPSVADEHEAVVDPHADAQVPRKTQAIEFVAALHLMGKWLIKR